MTFLSLIPASFAPISVPAPKIVRVSQTRLHVRRWLLFTAILFLLLGATHRSAAQATIHVNTTVQGKTDSSHCSVQEALYSANFDNNVAIDTTDAVNGDHFYTTGCEPGSGDDTIVLPAAWTFPMGHIVDDAHNYMGPTATPIVFTNITIEGNGAKLEPSANAPNMRAFAVGNASFDVTPPGGTTYHVSGKGNLTITNVYVRGFVVQGGSGVAGGGGGLGAGGVIYVHSGTLTIENSTFEANGASGGNGASGLAGGGGGFSGSGGLPTPSGLYGGGGGGGSRGKGGTGGVSDISAGGGGGGGTLTGGSIETFYASIGGYLNGGNGGGQSGTICFIAGADGNEGGLGGGGGGGESYRPGTQCLGSGNGGHGGYGGGGGGGGADSGTGGHGGFGGGGGASGFEGSPTGDGPSGGDGDFGGGGGASPGGSFTGGPGKGGTFGGRADAGNGGGGGALGGAIFNDHGTVIVSNSTFFNNYVRRGAAGGGSAENGADAGGAIFSLGNLLEITDSTFSGNQSTGSGGAIVVYAHDSDVGIANIFNNIMADNGASECYFSGGTVNVQGSGNLIINNGSGADPLIGTFNPCPGVVTTSDPQLQPLQINSPGNTPTMAILTSSPAANAADSAPCTDQGLCSDQRGVTRPQNGGYDIGAYEARPPDFSFAPIKPISVDVGGSGSAALTVNSFEYFNSPVTLSVSTPPTGVSVSFSANPVTPPYNASASSTLSVNLAPTVTAGSYTPTVTGTSSPLMHAVLASIVVTPTTAGITNVIGSFLTTGAIDKFGIANALTSKLSMAQSFISAGDNQTAVNILDALINQLNAQSGKHISASAASVLITDTQALQASLGANLRPDPVMGYVLNSSNAPIGGATVNVLNSSNAVVATATSDSTGFYFFPLTKGWTLGGSYTVRVTLPKGYKTSTPASQTFTWQAAQLILINSVLN